MLCVCVGEDSRHLVCSALVRVFSFGPPPPPPAVAVAHTWYCAFCQALERPACPHSSKDRCSMTIATSARRAFGVQSIVVTAAARLFVFANKTCAHQPLKRTHNAHNKIDHKSHNQHATTQPTHTTRQLRTKARAHSIAGAGPPFFCTRRALGTPTLSAQGGSSEWAIILFFFLGGDRCSRRRGSAKHGGGIVQRAKRGAPASARAQPRAFQRQRARRTAGVDHNREFTAAVCVALRWLRCVCEGRDRGKQHTLSSARGSARAFWPLPWPPRHGALGGHSASNCLMLAAPALGPRWHTLAPACALRVRALTPPACVLRALSSACA